MASNQELRVLGRTLGEIQDHVLAERVRPPTSDRLAAIYQARARQTVTARRLARSGALGLVAVAAAVLLALSFRPRPLGFVVGAAKAPGELGVWVAAAAPETTPLTFSDGSRVLLSAGAQARVLSTNEHGARVAIERGTARCEVVPRSKNDWFVVGGPFEIHVTGTSFDADWEPEQQALRVTMYEGHVAIRANCLAAPRSLGKGESVTLSCARPSASNAANATGVANAMNATSATNSALAPVPAVASPLAGTTSFLVGSSTASRGAPQLGHGSAAPAPGEPATNDTNETSPPSAPEPAPSWRELARQGKYKAALSAAEQAGFDDACRTLSASDLLELGTTARLAGSRARANTAYVAVRRRFAGTDSAATAAFHLGQLAFDSAGAYAEAKQWFAAYLSERPAGALAAEALGRQMEAEQRSGDLVAARATASSYLTRYPAGAHARLAQSLLSP